ncbi:MULTISPECIES: DUF2948 family protein [unclassified Mesorhizobium]|jgi:hypothetical protein|uniref:DUF2948 family protein n=1 Tax=unclassified Mesorhizobium TaxID=325217 RepID=UPI0008F45404|nr:MULTISPECIES: DUF2948 family protein [unclassified Mesorhizobium]RJG46556.1 DUF2948 family protein [Mesorhizobium sp. DCY119]SFT99462.1 Protein of unknown function [Mesorhizobium sp. YR577]
MDQLKLVALDEQDLKIVSAHVQDAVMKVGDLDFSASAKRFIMSVNRFAWETRTGFFRPHYERRKSVLDFNRVLGVRATGIDREKPEDVLSLLAIQFHERDAPAGAIELIFAGGGAIALQVECIEARLADLGAAWEASSRPIHKA